MTGTIARVRLLAAVALLLSGLLQTVASAQGVACMRGVVGDEPAPGVEAAASMRAPAGTAVADAAPSRAAAVAGPAHDHATPPGPEGAGIPSSACVAFALPAARAAAPAAVSSPYLSPFAPRSGGLTVPRSHFRPPRPS